MEDSLHQPKKSGLAMKAWGAVDTSQTTGWVTGCCVFQIADGHDTGTTPLLPHQFSAPPLPQLYLGSRGDTQICYMNSPPAIRELMKEQFPML